MFDANAFLKEVDRLVELVRSRHPTVEVVRYHPYNPTEDDMIWWFTHPGCKFEVQVDPNNDTLFIMSTDEHAEYYYANTVEDAAAMIERWLHINESGTAAQQRHAPDRRHDSCHVHQWLGAAGDAGR